jgi:hypothetical protein
MAPCQTSGLLHKQDYILQSIQRARAAAGVKHATPQAAFMKLLAQGAATAQGPWMHLVPAS